MCDVTLAITAATTMLSAAGAIQQGQAQAGASRHNAKVADMNARISQRRAKDALERGKLEEQRKRHEIAQLHGRQVAAMAANGVDIGFGSPLDLIVDTAQLGEIDALTIRRNAANENYDYRVQAVNGTAEAELSRKNASAAETGGYLQGFSTILGGASQGYVDYQSGKIGTFS